MDEEKPNRRYAIWLLVVSDVTGPELLGPLKDVEELIARLKGLVGKRVRAFPFEGHPYLISNGPMRHLLTPDGAAHPLYDAQGDLTADPSGMLYDPSAPYTGEDDEESD